MSRMPKQKRNYAGMSLEETLQLIGRETIGRWHIASSPRPPSDILVENLRRLEFFDLKSSKQAKTLLIDALFAEVVPRHETLKVWKEAALNTDTLTGVADYLIAPRRAYLATPLLCVEEARKDDFERGQSQCIAEMVACRWNNRQRGHDVDVYGIVSNGQGWQFYRLTQAADITESGLYTIDNLTELLGVLDQICAECARNVPPIAAGIP